MQVSILAHLIAMCIGCAKLTVSRRTRINELLNAVIRPLRPACTPQTVAAAAHRPRDIAPAQTWQAFPAGLISRSVSPLATAAAASFFLLALTALTRSMPT